MDEPITILGLDPGKTTGWAVIRVTGRVISLDGFGQTKDMQLIDIADEIKDATIVVYEGWRTRPNDAKRGAFNWGKMPAPEVIGAIKTIFRLSGRDLPTLVEQQPVQKVPGYGFAGMKYQKGKSGMHQEDALAHAVFYAVDKLGATPLRHVST